MPHRASLERAGPVGKGATSSLCSGGSSLLGPGSHSKTNGTGGRRGTEAMRTYSINSRNHNFQNPICLSESERTGFPWLERSELVSLPPRHLVGPEQCPCGWWVADAVGRRAGHPRYILSNV